MLKKVLDTIKKYNMILAGEKAVVGVSGGADSVCLIYVLKKLEPELGISVTAVHVDHGIRGEQAKSDALFVRSICARWDIPCKVYERDVPSLVKSSGMTEEEAGRKLRYECFARAAAECGASKVAVAHNRDDNAETFLFNLFRGSGVKGLSGMQRKAPMSGAPGIVLIRPLLDVSREQIEAFLEAEGISYVQDATNFSDEYSRNRIRHNILPQAGLINSAAADHIVRTAGMLGELDEWLEAFAKDWIGENCACVFGEGENRYADIPDCISELSGLQAGYVVRELIRRLSASLKDITQRHSDMVLELFDMQSGKSICLPGQLTAVRINGAVRLGYAPAAPRDEARLLPSSDWQTVSVLGKTFRYRLAAPGRVENGFTKRFDRDTITEELCLRGRREGDRIQVYNDGGSQSVKKFMADRKIPSPERGQIVLLAAGADILWIVGYRTSQAHKVTGSTGCVLEIEELA